MYLVRCPAGADKVGTRLAQTGVGRARCQHLVGTGCYQLVVGRARCQHLEGTVCSRIQLGTAGLRDAVDTAQ